MKYSSNAVLALVVWSLTSSEFAVGFTSSRSAWIRKEHHRLDIGSFVGKRLAIFTALNSMAAEKKASTSTTWFPTKATSDVVLNYHSTVKALYLRHVLVETDEMADTALTVLKSSMSTSADPFGDLAKSLSACIYSREEGGKIGWCDNPRFTDPLQDQRNTESVAQSDIDMLIPQKSILEMFDERKPKAGDILRLKSVRGIHLVRVDDVLLASLQAENISLPRRKLKGSGYIPQTSPEFLKPDPITGKKKTYQILTNGCQMNVSDSERLEGELQRIGLEKIVTDDPKKGALNADVILLNTCSIRDHAEQKVYDQLGPVAQRKRKGEEIAVVVAGCVAQQGVLYH